MSCSILDLARLAALAAADFTCNQAKRAYLVNESESRTAIPWVAVAIVFVMIALPICGSLYHYWVTIPRAITHLEALGGDVIHDTKVFTTYEIVDLSNTLATDEDLRYVKALGAPCLDIRNTHVTDAGLHYLYGIGFLTIDIDNTRVTNAGIAELKRQCRHCTVFRNGTPVGD